MQVACLRRHLKHQRQAGAAQGPRALMLHLTVDKPTSMKRQHDRFQEAVRLNEAARRSNRGELRRATSFWFSLLTHHLRFAFDRIQRLSEQKGPLPIMGFETCTQVYMHALRYHMYEFRG